jgi:hypothetical protein
MRSAHDVRESPLPTAPENSIEIISDIKNYLFVAEDDDEQMKWLDALNDCIEAKQTLETNISQSSNNPDDILIVCDDDHVYHKDMLEYHLKKRNEYPNDIICFRGDTPVQKRGWVEDEIKKYTLPSTHTYFPAKFDIQLNIPGHWHSVGYKREFFNNDFLDKDFLTACDNDDVLVGYYFKKNQRLITCVAWDSETDFRAVNDLGRGAHHFPIVNPLPFPSSGFNEFRAKSGDHMGRSQDFIWELLNNHNTIYTEK